MFPTEQPETSGCIHQQEIHQGVGEERERETTNCRKFRERLAQNTSHCLDELREKETEGGWLEDMGRRVMSEVAYSSPVHPWDPKQDSSCNVMYVLKTQPP